MYDWRNPPFSKLHIVLLEQFKGYRIITNFIEPLLPKNELKNPANTHVHTHTRTHKHTHARTHTNTRMHLLGYKLYSACTGCQMFECKET